MVFSGIEWGSVVSNGTELYFLGKSGPQCQLIPLFVSNNTIKPSEINNKLPFLVLTGVAFAKP